MNTLTDLLGRLAPALPMGLTLLLLGAVFLGLRLYYERRLAARPSLGFQRQITLLTLTVLGVLLLVVVSPLSDAQKGPLLSLLGLLLSGAIALSATTFLGNALAGIMLRAVRSFRMGDFIRVGDHFGRVSERGLFHTEIQTEERDLTTLPNLYLATNPVKVIRTSGTIVSAEVSLGYDVPRARVKELLLAAVAAAELGEGYVQVIALGDFSVVYRACGLLAEVKQLISARSRLREMMLDHLHEGGVEIVSPSFMNTRPLPEGRVFIPRPAPTAAAAAPPPSGHSPEDLAFDKAEEAESVEALQLRLEERTRALEALTAEQKSAATDEQKGRLAEAVRRAEQECDLLKSLVTTRSEKIAD